MELGAKYGTGSGLSTQGITRCSKWLGPLRVRSHLDELDPVDEDLLHGPIAHERSHRPPAPYPGSALSPRFLPRPPVLLQLAAEQPDRWDDGHQSLSRLCLTSSTWTPHDVRSELRTLLLTTSCSTLLDKRFTQVCLFSICSVPAVLFAGEGSCWHNCFE